MGGACRWIGIYTSEHSRILTFSGFLGIYLSVFGDVYFRYAQLKKLYF